MSIDMERSLRMIKSTSKVLAIAGAAAVLCGSAWAGSLAVGKKVEIDVDPKAMAQAQEALWKKFGGWCAISEWHPAVAKCEESKEGSDVFRTLTLKDGGKIKEKLLEQAPNRYRYAIIESPLPVKNYEAQFTLTPDDDDVDEVNFAWSAVFDPEGKPDKEARAVIDGIFKAGMDNIKAMASKDAPGDMDDDGGEKK